jgi:hypothetical protein
MFVRLLLALSLVVLIPILRAQTSTGEIDISVTDSTDAIIAGARVTIVGADTGATVRTVTTNASGIAAVPLLNPATYNVRVEKEGFKTLLRQGIILQVTEVVSLQARLELGAASQSVTIVGQSPLSTPRLTRKARWSRIAPWRSFP